MEYYQWNATKSRWDWRGKYCDSKMTTTKNLHHFQMLPLFTIECIYRPKTYVFVYLFEGCRIWTFFGISDNWNLFISMIILWAKVYGLLCLGVPISVTEIVLFLLKNSLLLLDIAQTNLDTILNSKDNYQCIGSLNSSTGASHAQYIFF